ncbi:hypothetical protein OHB39_39065 [Streptomyces sp. NBC_00047]|uniref:hypothetical protein n=1 Tax=Streptomyces sp. NBC_00047 TaxID=2975627 RepID=UPI00225842DA|nr:hypothetical protein [Streptomyces sp. NBC_00047]MCX5613458.1 hypothetical protein [Streptomyces sp. NBC_00047]
MYDDKPRTSSRPSLLTVYLNDHLTGSGAGVRLIYRIADRHRPKGSWPELAALAGQIEEDQQSLRRIMHDLDVPVRRLREVVGRIGEKAGRLKPNGRLLSRSPLSDVLELEAMLLGVEGKAACWRALRALAATDTRLDASDLDRLLARADAQSRSLEDLRRCCAVEALTAEPAAVSARPVRRAVAPAGRPGTT